MLTKQAWSPYLAGVVIGLLQIPAFLLIETALGASSSYVTVGGMIASWIDPSILKIDYVARHVAATGKNWWQVALVVGVAIGAFASMKLSGAKRTPISPIWRRALGSSSPAAAHRHLGPRGWLPAAARCAYRRRLHQWPRPLRYGATSGRLDRCGRRDVRGRYRDCNAFAAPHLRKKGD